MFIALVLVLGLAANANQAPHSKTVGIIGDSVATGAVSDYSTSANITTLLWNVVRRGMWSPKKTNWGSDFRDNAFSQIVATGFGVVPDNVINVAIDGQRVSSIAEQLTVLKDEVRAFPDYLFVSYTANDSCNENVFTTEIGAFKKEYLRRLIEGKDGKGGLRLLAHSAPADRETRIYLLASLDFSQVLTNESILQRQVPLHGNMVRCERFRAGQHNDDGRMVFLADKLRKMCPAILGTDPKAMDAQSVFRRKHLKDLHTAVVQAQSEAIAFMKQYNENPKVKFEFIGASATVAFNGTHVANDCFHLSPQGQGILGLAVWDEVLNKY